MVTAAWNTSNLVALYKDGKQCTTCCLFADSDCDCFTGQEWDDATPYVIGDTVLYEGIYYNCRADNTNKIPSSSPIYWFFITPYGGPGGTPLQISIVVWGITICDGIEFVRDPNGTHILDLDTAVGQYPCRYSKTIPAGDGFEALAMGVNMQIVSGTGGVSISSVGSASLFTNNPGSNCLLKQVFSNSLTECRWDPPFHPLGPPFGIGFNGTVQWRMGECEGWDSGVNYIVGRCVGHESVFYICNQDHTNQEPPNGSYWAPVIV